MRRLGALAIVTVFLLSGCAAGSESAPEQTPEPETKTELTIFAAASLGAAFDQIIAEFEIEHTHIDVLPIVLDGSSTLATQLEAGASADVFASADEKNMQKIVDAGLVSGAPEVFATNTLVVVTPVANPGEVRTLADLQKTDLTVVLCAADVPCGNASQKLLANAGLTVNPASMEQNVTAVLTKVAANEADVGLVYATDAKGRSDVSSFVPVGADQVVNRYPIAALSGSGNADGADEFVAFVAGARGQEILAEFGFGAP